MQRTVRASIAWPTEPSRSILSVAQGSNRDGRSLKERHRQIALSLMATAQPGLPADLNPYVRNHLAAHLAASKDWGGLAARLDLLDRLNPDSVAAAVLSHAFGHSDVALHTEVAAAVS